jgi:hypothetical protein
VASTSATVAPRSSIRSSACGCRRTIMDNRP